MIWYFKNLGQDKNGAGWNTGNSLFWQCTAAGIECYSPARDAVNRAYGCWAQFSGDGQWAESNNHVHPRSLFYAQLAARLNKDCSDQARIGAQSPGSREACPAVCPSVPKARPGRPAVRPAPPGPAGSPHRKGSRRAGPEADGSGGPGRGRYDGEFDRAGWRRRCFDRSRYRGADRRHRQFPLWDILHQ